MRLYMVEASEGDYDRFDSAVVYATSPDDAIAVVLEVLSADFNARIDAPGGWLPLAAGATLTATPVERKRGPVLGFGVYG